jgi:predicted LPLAT superfamily acyltransferase
VVPAFCVLDPAGGYRLHVEEGLVVSRGAEVDALRAAVGVLQRYVERYWDQWFNFYDVWEPRL